MTWSATSMQQMQSLRIYLWQGILLIEFHFDETSLTEYERHSFDMIHSVKKATFN